MRNVQRIGPAACSRNLTSTHMIELLGNQAATTVTGLTTNETTAASNHNPTNDQYKRKDPVTVNRNLEQKTRAWAERLSE